MSLHELPGNSGEHPLNAVSLGQGMRRCCREVRFMCVCMCSLMTACLLERDPYTVLADPHYVGVCRVIP